ncbi:MAG: DUF115 domain-containing protein [Treponema sp.]|nr:DUF115 domain-containing protein [Treponema sp.]
MSSDFCYSQIIEAKDLNLIPLCKNKVTGQEVSLHSKYNPIREAESFAGQTDDSCRFFVILGLAAGYHIEKILEKNPQSKIFVVERSRTEIEFLSEIPSVKKLLKNKRVMISELDKIGENLLLFYKPALHGNLTILSLRQWENIFQEEAKKARESIIEGIKLLSADYSVQCHFGKIWQKNIISNLSLAEKTKSFEEIVKNIDKKKKAAVIAAGPSLDKDLEILKTDQDYFIIATDTAFSALRERGIFCHAVVSIDAQIFSHEHYMNPLPEETLYVFDLCANSASVRKALKASENVILTESGHPLAQYASLYTGKRAFLHLESGSGTVTIAAASLAKKMGFSKIDFFGADFAYFDGKPYCLGTYLEKQFYSSSRRFRSGDQAYTKLMFRTALIKISENKCTTEILQAYKNSLADFMKKNPEKDEIQKSKFNYEDFKKQYSADLKKTFKSPKDYDEDSYIVTTLLPLCAKMGNASPFLAYLKTLSYTERV